MLADLNSHPSIEREGLILRIPIGLDEIAKDMEGGKEHGDQFAQVLQTDECMKAILERMQDHVLRPWLAGLNCLDEDPESRKGLFTRPGSTKEVDRAWTLDWICCLHQSYSKSLDELGKVLDGMKAESSFNWMQEDDFSKNVRVPWEEWYSKADNIYAAAGALTTCGLDITFVDWKKDIDARNEWVLSLLRELEAGTEPLKASMRTTLRTSGKFLAISK